MFRSLSRAASHLAFEDRFTRHLVKICLGALLLSFLAQFKIPMYPTPITLQPLGVFLLGLTLGSKRAFFSALLYLAAATMGWPVLSGGHSNPLWMISPNAGFLLFFPITAYLAGRCFEKREKISYIALSLKLTGAQLAMDLSGVIVLSYFFGFDQAIMIGFIPFVITNFVQRSIAMFLLKFNKGV